MQAKVISVTDGKVLVQVRRSADRRHLFTRELELRVGDRVEVKRQVNNPYLIFVRKIS